jgi:hypothetical protein
MCEGAGCWGGDNQQCQADQRLLSLDAGWGMKMVEELLFFTFIFLWYWGLNLGPSP